MHELKPVIDPAATLINVRKISRHRGYNSKTLVGLGLTFLCLSITSYPSFKYNDVAIITLDTPIAYSSVASPVCLPQTGDQFVGKEGVVIGWGTLKEGDFLLEITNNKINKPFIYRGRSTKRTPTGHY